MRSSRCVGPRWTRKGRQPRGTGLRMRFGGVGVRGGSGGEVDAEFGAAQRR